MSMQQSQPPQSNVQEKRSKLFRAFLKLFVIAFIILFFIGVVLLYVINQLIQVGIIKNVPLNIFIGAFTAAIPTLAAIVPLMPPLFSKQTETVQVQPPTIMPPPLYQDTTPVFCFNMPLRDTRQFYGHRLAVSTLIHRTVNGGSSSIVGDRRIGKTWLMTYLSLSASEHPALGPRFRIGILDASNAQCQSPGNFVELSLATLNIPHHFADAPPLQLKHLSQAILGLQKQQIVPVLCIDEFENISTHPTFDKAFFEGLRAMTQHEGLVLVTASRSPLVEILGSQIGTTSPFFNAFQQISLKPFTRPEAATFIQQRGAIAGFNAKEQAFLLEQATTQDQHGNPCWPPIYLQLVGQLLLNDKQAANDDHSLYQFNNPTYQQDFKLRVQEGLRSIGKTL